MLASLRNIIEEVNSARSLPEVLEIIVREMKEALNAGVCSIYLFDRQDQRYVLMATDGLRRQAIGKIRLGMREGLVGLVAAKEEPLNLQNADKHPNFVYFPEADESPFHSFLGVPIIHHRKVLGVLVLQQTNERRFAQEEETFLVTIGAQLSGAIAHADETGVLSRLSAPRKDKSLESIFRGIASSPGIGMGKTVLASVNTDLSQVPERNCDNVDLEVQLFNEALESAKHDMWKLGQGLKEKLSSEEFALFEVYIRLLDDPSLIAEVVGAINSGKAASTAWSCVILEHVKTFRKMEDKYLRERAADVLDLGKRVLTYLQQDDITVKSIPKRVVLVGEDLSATILADIPVDRLAGIISLKGSSNSHLAIVARALGIPTVMGATTFPLAELLGKDVIVDGFKGVIITRPSRASRRHYLALRREEELLGKDLERLRNIPCITPDGEHISLFVNTGLRQDVMRSLKSGAEAVGLYRTEIPFFAHLGFPTEDEQVLIYKEQLQAFAPKKVTMRTLDIGGDKALPYFPIEEENPFLGWRGIRISLDHPEIFLVQIRAMLRASENNGNLKIMLPMISSIGELDGALQLVNRAYEELINEEDLCIKKPPIGAMIEVPAAVYQVDQLAKRVDFLSVGTNDLTQYLLAVDRNNPRVASLYNSFHPSVLSALHLISKQANNASCEVSICGELAGDPLGAVLLVGLGYRHLSMSASCLSRVKSMLLQVSVRKARDLAERSIQITHANEVMEFLACELKNPDLTKLYHRAIE